METSTAIGAWDAIAALLPLIGGGGLTAIVVAFLAYRKESLQGRRGEPDRAGVGISALLADSSSIEKAVLSIDALAIAMSKIALTAEEGRHDFIDKFEKFIDEVRELRRAVQDLK